MRPDRREREAHRAFCRFRETGQPGAITRVFDLVAPRLVSLAAHLGGDRATADDLVQATFLDAIERADRFDPERPLIPWLTGILLHHARHEHRRARRRLDAGRLSLRQHEPSPDREAEAREFADLVAASLDRLPPLYRDVVRMRLVHGLEPAQIAAELQRPRETVKTQLARGIERLRRDLPDGVAPGLAALLAVGARSNGPRAAVSAFAEARAPRDVPVPRQGAFEAARTHARAWLLACGALATTAVVVALAIHGGGDGGTSSIDRAADDTATSRTGGGTERGPADSAPPSTARTPTPSSTAPFAVRVHWREDDRPAAGIRVSLRPAADTSWLREIRTSTDELGVARFDASRLPGDGPFRIRTDRGEPPHTVSAIPSEVDVALPPGIDVAGRVIDDTGGGIEGARIVACPPGEPSDTGAVVAVTDANGAFAVRDLPAGAGLGALADGWKPPVAIALGDTDSLDLVFTCFTRAAPIGGTVLDERGEPVAHAAVLIGSTYEPGLVPIGVPSRCFTDDLGRFACASQGSDGIAIWARAPGFAVRRIEVARAAPGGERRVELRLARGATVAGLVTRRDDASPVDAARVEVWQGEVEPPVGYDFDGPGWARVVAMTDSSGRYEVHGILAGTATVRVAAPDGARSSDVLELIDGERASCDVALGRGTTLSGQVVDDTGSPLVDWRVSAWEMHEERAAAPVRTDGEGRFEVPRLETGRRYRLFVQQDHAPGGGAGTFHVVTARTRPIDPIRVPREAIAASWIDCRLVGPGGAIERAGFDLMRIDDEGAAHRTHLELDADTGRYHIGPLLAGRHALVATVEGLGLAPVGTFELGKRTTVDVGTHVFTVPATLHVKVSGPDGGPAAIGSVELQRDDLFGMLSIPLTAGEGDVRIQPGRWWLTYLGHVGTPLCEALDAHAGERIDRVAQIDAGVDRRLRFAEVPCDGCAVSFAWYTADGEPVFRESRILNLDHVTPWAARLRPGAYRVVARDGLGREAVTEFEVTTAPSDDAVIGIRLPGTD